VDPPHSSARSRAVDRAYARPCAGPATRRACAHRAGRPLGGRVPGPHARLQLASTSSCTSSFISSTSRRLPVLTHAVGLLAASAAAVSHSRRQPSSRAIHHRPALLSPPQARLQPARRLCFAPEARGACSPGSRGAAPCAPLQVLAGIDSGRETSSNRPTKVSRSPGSGSPAKSGRPRPPIPATGAGSPAGDHIANEKVISGRFLQFSRDPVVRVTFSVTAVPSKNH
jgi:hypothetical protein